MIYDTSPKLIVAPTRRAALDELLQYGITEDVLATLPNIHIVTTFQEAFDLTVPPGTAPWCLLAGNVLPDTVNLMKYIYGPQSRVSDVIAAKHADVAVHPKTLERSENP